jgi:hypothetical protein
MFISTVMISTWGLSLSTREDPFHNEVKAMSTEEFGKGASALEAIRQATDSVTSDAYFAALARAREARVRAAIAEGPDTPLAVLLILAKDVAPAVRAAVARNPRVDLPLQIRETLAQDKSVEVLLGLIDCPNLPDVVLSKLSRSTVKKVAIAAKERTKIRNVFGGSSPKFGQVRLASS